MNKHNQSLDIVIPICDGWRIPYLENCLHSIRRQTTTQALKRIIVAFAPPGYRRNGKSTEAQKKSRVDIERAAQRNGAEFVDGENDYPLYSLAYSRNLGAKRAKSLIIGFIDCDLVLHPQTFALALGYMGPAQAVCVFASRMPFRPEHPVYRESKNFAKTARSGQLDTAGKGGGCFFIDRLLFNRVRGYDERLYGWGYEDVDMLKRLHNESVMIGNLLSDNIFAMHQHHDPNVSCWSDQARTEENKRIAFSDPSIARNPSGFGRP